VTNGYSSSALVCIRAADTQHNKQQTAHIRTTVDDAPRPVGTDAGRMAGLPDASWTMATAMRTARLVHTMRTRTMKDTTVMPYAKYSHWCWRFDFSSAVSEGSDSVVVDEPSAVSMLSDDACESRQTATRRQTQRRDLSLTHTRARVLSHTHTLSHTLAHTHTHTLSLSHSLSLSVSATFTPSRSPA
jgi:hypothetical protein